MVDTIDTAMPRVGYRDLRGYLALLEKAGLLSRVKAPVDLKGEIGAICTVALDRRTPPGLLFEHINGYPGMRLVSNILCSTEKLAITFNTEADDMEILAAIHAGKATPMPPRVVDSAPAQEVVHMGDEVDLSMFPTPLWHEGDGGPYIGTTAGVVTADPDTGYLNCGMYRCMIADRNTVTAHIKGGRGGHPVGEDPAKTRYYGGDVHILKNEARGRSTPVAIAIGMDPLLTLVAAQEVPSDSLENAEYAVAGAWMGAPIDLVKCKTSDLLVPAWAEIVLEGEALLNERRREGPHGESAGYYNSGPSDFVVRIHCITHRRDPINYGLVCRPLEDYPKFLHAVGLRKQLLDMGIRVKDVYTPDWTPPPAQMAIVAATIEGRSDVEAVIAAVDRVEPEKLIAGRPRWLIIVDDDCDVRNWDDVMWRTSIAARLDADVRIRPGTRDTDFLCNWSIVIDATRRGKPGVRWGPGSTGEAEDPVASKPSAEMLAKVQSRWREYGLD